MRAVRSLAVLALFAAPACALAQEKTAPAEGVAPVSTEMKVHWHRSLAEAQAAAAKTGKPILHFQLLGDLDQEFC